MSDKDPLLKKFSKQSRDKDDDDDGNNEQLSASTFSDWHRCFGGKEADDQYRKLDDGIKDSDNGTPVGILHLFRFADRIDLLLIFITVCMLSLRTLGRTANLVFSGRLMGLFVVESFADSCHHQKQNSIIPNTSNYICPPGIVLHQFNYVQLHRLCRNSDVILSSTLASSMPSFRAKVMYLVYCLLVIGTSEFICGTLQYFAWHISMKRQASRMSVRLFESLLQRNISYLDTKPTSELSFKLFDNIVKIERGIGSEFLLLVATLSVFVTNVIASFLVSWKLTLVMLCLLPAVFAVSFVFSKITADGAMKELITYSKAGHIVQEVFSSFRTVLSLNGTKFEQKRYDNELHPTRWSSVRQGAILGVFVGWLSFMTYIVYSVGFIFGSIIMSHENHHKLTISDIIVVLNIFAQCMTFLSSVGPFFQAFSEARGAAAQVFQLIDEAQEASINETELWKENRSHEEIVDINGDIEFDNINLMYPSRKGASVLNNLNLVARVGQTTALVGSSGCGKSTSVSLLLRYYEPSSGRIMINGRSITDYNLKQLRKNIGVVSQEPILFGMSIYENIRFGKVNATRAEIEEAARQANAHNFIMHLPNKYETLVGERGIQLSGGEKQRIALARALVKQPTLLLLDEATSALDTVSEKIVQEALDRACQGRTTIVIAHRLTTIQNAHHIYVLDSGSVIEHGTHETLMAKEGSRYQEMVKSQQAERIYDNEDDIMSKAKVDEEDEKQIFERSRLFSDSQDAGTEKESSTSSSRHDIFLRLLSMNSPEWITLLIGCVASLLNGAARPIFAILLVKIVNAFKDCGYPERLRQVLTASFFFLLVGLVVLILRFLQYTAFAISGSKLTQRIRSKAFACLLRQEVAYFDRSENSSGAICTRLSTDALAIQHMTGARLGMIFESLSLTFFGIFFGILFSWQLTMIVFIPFFILIVVVYLSIRLEMWLSQQYSHIRGRASTLAIEVIHNMRTIKQLSVEKEVLQQYSEFMHQIFMTFRKYSFVSAIPYGLFLGLNIYSAAFLYWRALVLVEQKKIDLSNIVMIFAVAVFAMQVFGSIRQMAVQIGASLSAARSFIDLFDRIPVIDNTSNEGQELIDFRGEIEFAQVKFAYPTRPTTTVLKKFQLKIKPGQRVALVGASGCGKSTIVQLLERFYDVEHGQLLLDGVDIRQLNIHWIRSRFGLVSQEPILFDLTIAENIAYGLENVPMEDIINAATKANIHGFIQQLPKGYETNVGMKGSFLSGGEKQRIAIARALIRRPKVLLLDEATSAMDSHNERVVQQALEQAQTEDLSRTSLIIAHRLSTIRSCDLICVVDKGHIVESGTHTELIQRRGAYYKMLTQDNL